MVVGTLQIEIEIPGAQSLKDKRRVVRSIKDSYAARFRVSAAEVGALDVRNRALIGFAIVSNSDAHAGAVLDAVENSARASTESEVLAVRRTVAHPEDLPATAPIDTGAIDEEMIAHALGDRP